MMAEFAGRSGAATHAAMKQVEDVGAEIGRHEIELIEAQQEARRTEPHERQAFRTRFNLAKARIGAADLNERIEGRAALVAEFRRLIEGVVLHPNRSVTLHTKPDAPNNGTTYLINAEGLEGVHIRLADGRTGFIGSSLLLDRLLKPDTRPSNSRQKSRNWQTVAVAPMPVAEIVSDAQRVLASKEARG